MNWKIRFWSETRELTEMDHRGTITEALGLCPESMVHSIIRVPEPSSGDDSARGTSVASIERTT